MFSGVRSISSGVRFSFAVLLVTILTLSAPLTASAAGLAVIIRAPNIVSNILLVPRSANIIAVNQQVSISFRYNTSAAAGTIVTATPFSGTAATAGATDCTTALLPVGSGSGTCTISVGTAGVTVNSIHFQMWDSTQKTMLYQEILPVSYLVRGGLNSVTGFTLVPAAPGVVVVNKGVSVKFNYKTNQPAGVRIIAVPFSGTAATLNAATCGATIYAVGSGSGTCRFSVSTAANVTSLHIQMWDAAHTTKILEEVIPAVYHFRNGATMLTAASLSPQTPNIVRLGNKVTVHFNYDTNQAAGIIVTAKPYTAGTPTAGATLTPSALLPTGTGKGISAFTLTGSSVTVNGVLIQVWDSTKTTVLFAIMLPVNYQFK